MATRRDFVKGLGLALGPLAAGSGVVPLAADEPQPVGGDPRSSPPTGSDVGSLFPFISGQAVRGEFPLSFLRDEFGDLPAWKKVARGKLSDLLHYDPPPCDPQAEVVARLDCGDHVR